MKNYHLPLIRNGLRGDVIRNRFKMKGRKIIGFLLATFLLFGCENELHDNYINLEKPADVTDFDIIISLDVESDGETIYLLDYDEISYIINMPTYLSIKRCVFSIDDKIMWISQERFGTFMTQIINKQERHSVLTCDIYVSSGTGSIADQLGSEYYYGTFSWPVEFFSEPMPSLTHSVSDDGYLELLWEKPKMIESNFICYRVFFNHAEYAVISDKNQHSCEIKSYFGNPAYFTVVAEFRDNKSWDIGTLSLNILNIEISEDYSIVDSVKLSWNNPYNSSVSISVKGKELVSYTKNKSACIPRSLFGMNKELVHFSFFSYNEEDRIDKYSFTTSKYLRLSLGDFIATNDDSPILTLGYNKSEDVIYTGLNGNATSWLLPDFKKYKVYYGSGNYLLNRFALSMYDNKMAIQYSVLIELFEGKDMASVKTIPCYPFRYYMGPITLTRDGKIISFAYDNNGSIKGLVYSASSGTLESTFDVQVKNENVLSMRMSSNARYLIVPIDMSGVEIMTIDSFRVVKTEVINIKANSWCLNPLKEEELFISSNGKIFKYNCSDLTVDDVFDFPGMDVCNIDPKTGYLLLLNSTSSSITIINPETKQILYTLPVYFIWGVQLMGNSLFSMDGYVLNLDNYLSK